MRNLIAMLSIALALAVGAQTNVTYVPAVTPAYVRGQLAAATNATAVRARADLSEHTNSSSHLTPAQAQRISAALTNETDAIALEALATNRVTRWYNSATNWLAYSGGKTITEYWVTGAVETNITFSSDFSDTGTSQTLYPMTLPWPFDYSGWVGHDIDYLGTVSHYISSPGSGAEWICPIENSTLSPLSGNSAGTATISTAPIVGALVYKLQTNDVPPETWSYANMTNWLTEGGAGETWAIGIASDVANPIVNNHANTSGLHLIAGDRAKIDGAVGAAAVSALIYSNSVSQLMIYTNASGAATSGWQVVHGVTSSWSFAQGTAGAITNGMNGVTFGESSSVLSIVSANGSVSKLLIKDSSGIGYPSMFVVEAENGSDPAFSFRRISQTFGDFRFILRGGYGDNYFALHSYDRIDRQLIIHSNGNIGIDNTNPQHKLSVTGDVGLSGKIYFGPIINGKQMTIDTDGTNVWRVNVNSVTNAWP